MPTPTLILLPDTPRFTIADVNNAYLEIAGVKREHFMGKGFFEAFPENPYSKVAEQETSLKNVISSKSPSHTPTQVYEYPSTNAKDVNIKYFNSLNTPVLNEDNEVEFIIRTVTDVSEMINIRQNEELVKTILDYNNKLLVETHRVAKSGSWEVDLKSKTITWSAEMKDIFEVDEHFVPGYDAIVFFKQGQHRDNMLRVIRHAIEKCIVFDVETQIITAKGNLRWLRITGKADTVIEDCHRVYGTTQDITETKRIAEMDLLAKTVLELNAKKDAAIEDILTVYLEGIEELFPQMKCSLLQVKNNRLHNWASPSLPKSYIKLIENLPISASSGSCGTAAWLKERVIVSDIANDPLWADYNYLASPYNLKACWSYPIIDSEGVVMCVFGIYYHEVKFPDSEELEIIERAATILKIILENRQTLAANHENALLMAQGQELANFGIWKWDIQHNTVSWSDTLYHIYGIDKKTFKATFEGYLELLHSDDRERIYMTIKSVLDTKKDIVFEERIIRPGGEMRYLKSWARVQVGEAGEPIRMIGACLDVTENKLAEIKLNEMHKEVETHLKVLEASEKRYSDLFHLSPLPMWVYDIDTLRFLSINNAAITQYGYTRDEFLKMRVNELFLLDENVKLEETLDQLKRHNELNYSGIFKHQKKNGDIIQVFTQSNAIQFNAGNTHLELATDITERQNYIDAIEKQNQQLQEISWIQSHVVRAPVARIMGLIELFNSSKITMDDKEEITRHILTSVNELDTIIRDISSKTEQIVLSNSPELN